MPIAFPASALVRERFCGSCTACCRDLTINSPELRKPAGVTCPHCTPGRGCGTYASRPQVCALWYCFWRFAPNLDESWRPDRVGLIIGFVDPPSGYDLAVKVDVIGGAGILKSDKFFRFLQSAHRNDIGVYISAPGKTGFAGGRSFISAAIASAIAEDARDKVLAMAWQGFLEAKAVPQVPIELDE